MNEKHTRRKLRITAKGKHVKKSPVKVRKLTIILMILGALMVITAVTLEAENYPWGKFLGLGSQNEASVPDPSPLDFSAVPPSPAVSGSPAVTSSANLSAVMTILPGDVEPAEATETLEDYNFQVLGIFKIPILKVSQNLLEGSAKQMKFGVGHVTGTAMPGQPGNCVIAGHRPWPFRYLDTLVTGDSVVIKIDKMKYTYQVYDSFEVLPTETWVLESIWGEKYTLTLITCTPYMVSSHRLIVRARLTDINGQTPAEFYHEEVTEAPYPEPIPSDTPAPAPDASPSVPTETTASAAPDSSASPDPSVSPNPSASPDSAPPSPGDTPAPQTPPTDLLPG